MNPESSLLKSIRLPLATLVVFLLIWAGNYEAPPQVVQQKSASIIPLGKVTIAQDKIKAVVTSVRNGEQVYNVVCAACHNSGVAGSPKLDDTNAWQTRLANGYEILKTSVLNGKGVMPMRAGCTDCSDEELFSAIDYILLTNKLSK